MAQPFNSDAQVVLKQARRIAESSDGVILPIHLLHALFTEAPAVWSHLPQIDMRSLFSAVPKVEILPVQPSTVESAPLSNSVKRVLAYAMEEWFRARGDQILPESVAG